MGERLKQTTEELWHELRGAGERAWEVTRQTAAGAGTKAAVYGRSVQRRIDLAKVDGKIDTCYRELGKRVFARVSGAQGSAEGGAEEDPKVRWMVDRLAELHEEQKRLIGDLVTLHGPTAPDAESRRQA